MTVETRPPKSDDCEHPPDELERSPDYLFRYAVSESSTWFCWGCRRTWTEAKGVFQQDADTTAQFKSLPFKEPTERRYRLLET